MMTHSEAEILLYRYFEGETSLDEELRLREYFRAGDIRSDLAELDPMFAYWDEAAQIVAPPAKQTAIRRRIPVRRLSAAAAAAVLFFAVGSWFNQPAGLTNFPIAEAESTTIDWSKYEVTDPEEAYKVLRNALGTASAEMNRSARITVREISAARNALK
ncbi:hypothetical protein FUA23_09810 [Neolewinella aurantiaca]|uniref:Uncharacterized protein n=1 Tax=Neolewinella aurantiaca TaxID=2602767 RepID=A0A5C7FF94_9BACT|nr:hypothetical protein [Neolewinella aurantiaca]TXF89493.1 hypothetical protein FUA23_09810 [Neolewinella aurantiaca]